MRNTPTLVLGLAVIGLLAGACSGATPTAGVTPAPAGAPTASVGTAPTQPYPVVPAGTATTVVPGTDPAPYPVVPEGQALVADRCTKCHDLSRVQSAKKPQADWLSTVNRMKGKGAVLNDLETEAVVAYLAATFK